MPTDLTRLFTYPHCNRPTYALIELFPITMPGGVTWQGSLWTRVAGRKGGRRIQVHDGHGVELFDTDDAFDLANARNALELWLAFIQRPQKAAAVC